jgi:alkanesulfonate monooxygenase SsuD/methylene tetrahydromethanopterin reductase-like flavin-dependent oxidoreductase (luciferase family)
MKLSLLTFGDYMEDPVTGELMTPTSRLRTIVEAAVLADEGGWWGVNLGEHHAGRFVLSSPPVVLAAIAERTEHLRLGTGVALAATLDPVRLAEDYATLDVISGGRVEVAVGRGNLFPHTYALFGQDIDDSRALFEENVETVLALWSEQNVSYPSKFRTPLEGITLQPPTVQKPHPPLWIGGGGSPETAELAARLGLPLALPSAFSDPMRFVPVVEQYRERFASYGHADRELAVAACWHVNVTRNSQEARRRWRPRYEKYFHWFADQVKEQNPGYKPHAFDYEWLLGDGPAIGGSPAEAVEKLLRFTEVLQTDTHLLYLGAGGMPTDELLEMIELMNTDVLPELKTAQVGA